MKSEEIRLDTQVIIIALEPIQSISPFFPATLRVGLGLRPALGPLRISHLRL